MKSNGKGSAAVLGGSFVEDAHLLPPDEFAEKKLTHDGRQKPKAKTQSSAQQQVFTLTPIKIAEMTIRLIGDSPLITHRWSTKARLMMLAKQMKEAIPAKEAKVPKMDYAESMYWLTERPKKAELVDAAAAKGRFGFPSIAFKAAAVNACSFIDGITKVEARGAFHVLPSLIDGKEPAIDNEGTSLVEIFGKPVMREDMVRIAMGTADIRHRGEFRQWACNLRIKFNASVFNGSQIIHLFEHAGFSVGVGEWRPACDGSNGMFHVERGSQE